MLRILVEINWFTNDLKYATRCPAEANLHYRSCRDPQSFGYAHGERSGPADRDLRESRGKTYPLGEAAW